MAERAGLLALMSEKEKDAGAGRLRRTETYRGVFLNDERAKPDGQSDGERVKGDIDDAAEQRHPLAQAYRGDRIRDLVGVTARGDANDRKAGDGAFAGERHELPAACAALRAQLLGRHGERSTIAASNRGERSVTDLLEESAGAEGGLSHDRIDSRARWRCCRRACG